MPAKPKHPPIETPFTRRLQREWMWKQEPPLTNATQLAQALDISVTGAINYLNKGMLPEFAVLVKIAQKTGLSLITLMRDCGYPVPSNIVEADRLARFLEENIDKNASYSGKEIATQIRELTHQYEESQKGTAS